MVDPLAVILAEPGTSGLDLLEQLTARPAWHADASCRGKGPAAWFPPRGQDSGAARNVCAGCPVQVECGVAGRGEKHGIWGGRTADDRRHRRPAA